MTAPGFLFLVGGKDGRNGDRILIDRFVQLCGGISSHVLVVTTASAEPKHHRREYGAAFRAAGAREVSIFHAADRDDSDRPALLSALDRADGVYFTGGLQRRLLDAMGGTAFNERLRELHREGLHVGGTSAGASALSAVMIANGRRKPPIRLSSVELSPGFGLLPQVIVDQHFRQRERFARLLAAVARNPAMLGFGVDEATAVEIHPSGRILVLGAGALTVVDGSDLLDPTPENRHETDHALPFSGMRMHLLVEGWRYSLETRTAKPP